MRRQLRFLPFALILCALAALCIHRERERDALHLVEGTGPFWRVERTDGEVDSVSAVGRQLWLRSSQGLRLFAPDGGDIASARLVVQRTTDTATLAFEIARSDKDRSLRLSFEPGAVTRAAAARVGGELPDFPLTSATRELEPERSFQPMSVRVDVSSVGCALFLDDEVLLAVAEPDLVAGAIQVRCDGGRWAFSDLSLSDAAGNLHRDDLSDPPDRSAWTSVRVTAILGAAAFVLILMFLRALCLRPPPRSRWIDATAASLVPPALVAMVLAVASIPPILPAAAALVPGLLVGVFLLREYRSGDDVDGRRGAIRSVAVATTLVATTAWIAGSQRHRDLELRLTPAREAAALDDLELARPFLPRDPIAYQRIDLGPYDATGIVGRFRDFELTGRLSLGEASAVEVRFRSPGGPDGIALVLSSDPDMATGFYLQAVDRFEPLGATGPALPAGRELALLLRTVGPHLTATIDGDTVARADESRFPRGSFQILAMGGRASLTDVTVTPHPASVGDVADPLGPALRTAAVPAAMVVAFAFLFSALASIPWLRALETSSFSLVPWGAALVLGQATSGSSTVFIAGAVATVLTLLVGPMALHRRLGGGRYLGLVAAACAVVPVALRYSGPDADLREARAETRNQRINEMRYEEWEVADLTDRWVHVQHPLLRRFHEYLVDHRLRGRRFAARGEETKRVLALGSSSTYGYNLPAEHRDDWPARLEDKLSRSLGADVEVVNGAVCGSTGIRLYHLLRNALLELRPDVVVLSLYYNDSVALSQGDEPAYLDEAIQAEGRPGVIADLLDRAATRRERAALRTLLARPAVTDTSRRWTELTGDVDPSPALRFEGVLTRFASLAAERGFRLVLVKEAVADDRPRMWKEEFYAAIDRVGAAHGLDVVDPRPALSEARRRGVALFMDEVHLRPEGCEVMATVIHPVVRDLLVEPDPRAASSEGTGTPTGVR